VGTGQRVAIFVGLILVLAGIGIGVRPVGHATGSLATLYCTVTPDGASVQPGVTPYLPGPPPNVYGHGPCPSNQYDFGAPFDVERNCGSAFFASAYDSGAYVHGSGLPAAGTTQAWSQVPPCSGRLSTWRYPALSLVFAGLIVALAGFVIFRTRKPASHTDAVPQ